MVNLELIPHPSCFIFFKFHESYLHLVMLEMFSCAGCVSSEWKRLQAAQVLSKSVGLRFICHNDEEFV